MKIDIEWFDILSGAPDADIASVVRACACINKGEQYEAEGLSMLAKGIVLMYIKQVERSQTYRANARRRWEQPQQHDPRQPQAQPQPQPTEAEAPMFSAEALKDEMWISTICMSNSIKAEDMQRYIAEFDSFLITQVKTHTTLLEYKRHFANWIRSRRLTERSQTATQPQQQTSPDVPLSHEQRKNIAEETFRKTLYRTPNPRQEDLRLTWRAIENFPRYANCTQEQQTQMFELCAKGLDADEIRKQGFDGFGFAYGNM